MSSCQGDQAEGVEQSNQPTLCSNGCGFFANQACNNMCSKCYRGYQLTNEGNVSASKAAAAALSDVSAKEVKESPVSEKAQITEVEAVVAPSLEQKRPETLTAAMEAQTDFEGHPEPSVPSTSVPHLRPPQNKPGRCFTCNKKVGLTGFKCRCEYVFCGAHRLAEAHACSFNYKQAGRERLAANNPLIQASKFERV